MALLIDFSQIVIFYNWSLRSGQWQQFLHAIDVPLPPEAIEIKEEENDGTID